MSKSKWIHPSNIPLKLPLTPSIVLWLLLDRLQAAGWVQGVAYTILGILWIGAIIAIFNSERLEEFK